jgi:putative tricarboxylic transport membrane protein
MDIFSHFLGGLQIALQPANLFYCFIGTLVGTFVGVLPGIGPTAAMALLLPATFHLNPISAVIMLCGINYGSQFGGSTTSILVNIPGETSSVVTCFDGYQMARKGRAGPALGMAALGSLIAGTVAVVGLMLVAPSLAKASLRFGAPEFFSLLLASMLMVTYLVSGSMLRAIMMVAVGLVFGTVGMDIIAGAERFTYGIPQLKDGIGVFPLALGLFGVAQVLEAMGSSVKTEVLGGKIKGNWPNRQDWKDSGGPIARGTLLGFLMGVFPGFSPMLATFMSYSIEKKLSKHPERFGTGTIEGVAAPESCNNACCTSGYIPLFALGIPSNSYNAVLLGAMTLYGLRPGPTFIAMNAKFFWGIIASMYIGNVLCLILNLPLIPLWVQVLRIPATLLSVLILIFCFLGAYTINYSVFDVAVAVTFGLFGYLLKKYEFEPAPLVLAFILGPQIEMTFGQSMIMSDGSLMIFISRPISAFFVLLALTIIVTGFLGKRAFAKQLKESPEV